MGRDIPALTIDVETRTTTNHLPPDCTLLAMQFLDENGDWQPPMNKLVGIERKEAVATLKAALKRGPLKHKQYRLVPVSEEHNMAVKKGAKKKGKGRAAASSNGATRPVVEKLAGKFVADSEIGRMFTLLSDGKEHTKADIIKRLKPETGKIAGKTRRIKEHGGESGLYTLHDNDDTLRLVFSAKGGSAKKKAASAASVSRGSGRRRAAPVVDEDNGDDSGGDDNGDTDISDD